MNKRGSKLFILFISRSENYEKRNEWLEDKERERE